MRKLSQLSIVKQVDADFPNGAIINETDTQDGTPVVRELYNDIVVNAYAVMDAAGIEFDGTEDKEGSYQLLEAFQKLPNLLNDSEQTLTLTAGVWSVPFNLTTLPDKYFFFARPTDAYVAGDFIGNDGETLYSFTSPTGFNASDIILVIIDQSGVRAYSVASATGATTIDNVFTVFGTPVAFNDEETMYFNEGGSLLSDTPSASAIESVLVSGEGIADLILIDIFIMQGHAVCIAYLPTTITYKAYHFPLNDLSSYTELAVEDAAFAVGADFEPYFYADAENVYITNETGTTVNDNIVHVLTYNPGLDNLVFSGAVTLDASFVKTSNAAVKAKLLYTLTSGELNNFNLNTGTKTPLGTYTGVIGNLFTYNDTIYYGSGEVAQKMY